MPLPTAIPPGRVASWRGLITVLFLGSEQAVVSA